MENKYYTPSIEEFHIGFEYESTPSYREADGSPDIYATSIFTLDEVNNFDKFKYLKLQLDSGLVRVKYLDREDIESLGFEHVGAMWFKIQSGEYRLRWWKNHEVDIWKGKHDMENMIIFRGIIKNKSELKRILVQLGIK